MRLTAGRGMVWATALMLCGAMPALADTANTRSTSTRAQMSAITETSTLPTGRYGYILIDAVTGDVLSARNEDALFIPASLAKIPTTLAALSTAGGDRRFDTRVIATGGIENGVLKGDLHLVGSGDPTLRTRDLGKMAAQLARAGITRVEGRFTYEAGALPIARQIDAMQPPGKHYNPAVSGLNLDYNLKLVNGRRVPVSQPALYAAATLRHLAKAYGIELPLPLRATRQATGETVALHQSAPLSDIAAGMMELSTNLTAEVLGAVAVTSMQGKPKTLRDGAEATTNWLRTESGEIGGVGWDGFKLVNHSGLSTRSRATPRQIAAILRLGYQKFGKTFVDLHKRTAPGGYQAFDLHGKIGTMRFVRGYGGYLTIDGRDMVFAIMANDSRRRSLADAGQTGMRSQGWMTKARHLERDVLSEWVADHWSHTGSLYAEAVAAPAPVEPAPVQSMAFSRTTMRPVEDHTPQKIEQFGAPISAPMLVELIAPVQMQFMTSSRATMMPVE